MKTYVSYGAICAIAAAVFSLLLYFLGFQTEKLATGQYIQWIGFVFFVVILFLGMKDARENRTNGAISYGGAVGAAALISVFAGLFTGIYYYVHYSFVNPHFAQYLLDFMRTKFEASGMPEAQIEATLSIQGKMLTPAIQAAMTIIMTPIMGTLIGLILAIFVKKAAPQDTIKAA